ncbi:hypothetical protein JM946_24080 [Steroidobacter sp. S1-65]|uniref:DUF7684 domain-containing protein n=2 Tax=Steroidobacter gossypii TaxID=2805490 RepID=A0ABS1X3M0_9GAMM|nr:hypothetical protein [Steroidobacter gossypii]
MRVIAESQGRIYISVEIERPDEFASPFPGALFPCLIWYHGSRFGAEERSALARALLEGGCRYAVCGGVRCKDWHDAVDSEFVKNHMDDPDEALDEVHVMTTWHENESADDVGFFFVLHTNFDFHDFDRYLVLHVGRGREVEHVDAAVRKYALGEEV